MVQNSMFLHKLSQKHFSEWKQWKPYARHYKPQFVHFYPIFHWGLYCRVVYNAEQLIFLFGTASILLFVDVHRYSNIDTTLVGMPIPWRFSFLGDSRISNLPFLGESKSHSPGFGEFQGIFFPLN